MNLGESLGDDAVKALRDEQKRRDKKELERRRNREIQRSRRLNKTVRYQREDDA